MNNEQNKIDKIISRAVLLQFLILAVNYTIKEVLNINNSAFRESLSLLSMLIVGTIFLFSFKYVWKRSGFFLFFNIVVLIVIVLINSLFFNDNITYILQISFWLFGIALPTSIYMYAIKDKSIFLEMLNKYSYYLIFVAWIYGVKVIIDNNISYDMVYSYQLLLPTIVLINKLFNRFKFKDLIIVLITCVLVLLIGSRGPLLAIGSFVTYKYIERLFNGKVNIRNLFSSFIVISIWFTVIIFKDELLSSINTQLINQGIHSRTIYLLTESNIDISTGRSDIFTSTINNFYNNPIIGYGLAGDRLLLNGTYPHNFILEILYQFGAIAGLIFISLILIGIISVIVGIFSKERELIIIFVFVGFIPLFYSGSYLTSTNFWIMIYLIIAYVCKKKGGELNKKANY